MLARRFVLAVAVASLASPALAEGSSAAKTTAAHAHVSAVAPADEYFGRLKMSVLGIANVIKDMRLRVEADTTKTPSIFGSLALVEDAIHDWEHKYPRDSWIPRSLLALEVAYLHAQGDRAHEMAVRTEAWLRHDYPKTRYASDGRAELARADERLAAAAAPVAPAPAAPVPAADVTVGTPPTAIGR